MQVKFLEVVDKMVGHLLVRLHDAEQQQQQQQQQQHCICITGDHSTPVVFGDHSHEPVPFAAARVSDTVAAMGGVTQLDLRRLHLGSSGSSGSNGSNVAAAAGGEEVGRIPLPNVKQPPPLGELVLQAQQQQNRRRAAAAAVTGDAAAAAAVTAGGSGSSDVGPWGELVPQQLLWDGVLSFDELSAARGCLGRFTGAGVMPLLRQFCGWGA